MIVHISICVVEPIGKHFRMETARSFFPPLTLSVHPLACHATAPFCLVICAQQDIDVNMNQN